jgi:TPP-dependent indolepyruvate ferredoxin oxidoreductase alpha subunit
MINPVEKIIEKMDPRNQASVGQAMAEAINDNNVKVGMSVAVVGDPTYPFDGCKGVVKAINGGFADVEFANNVTAPLHINLLIPV